MGVLPTRSRRWGVAVAVAVMALVLSGCVNVWPQFGYGPARTSFNPDETTLSPANVSTLTSKWEQNVQAPGSNYNSLGGVVVAEGLVFLASGSAVFALDEATGSIRWSYPVTDPGDVVYDNGKVLFSSLDRHVQALVASSGALLWRVPTLPVPVPNLSQPVGGALTAFAGKVYFIGSDTRMYALDEQTGQQVNRFDLGGPGPMAIDPATGDIYVVVQASGLNCCPNVPVIDAYSPAGELLWVEATNSNGMPVIADGRVYVDNEAFDAATGKQVWINTAAGPVIAATADGMVFGIWGLQVRALDAATGQELWSTPAADPAGTEQLSDPVVANGVVYLHADETVKAFDEHTGALLATVVSPRPLIDQAMPVVADGKVFSVTFPSTGGLGVDVFGLP